MSLSQKVYPHANTVVAMEDAKLLKQNQYHLLLNADGLQTTLDILNRTNYFHTYKHAQTDNYSQMLDELMIDTFGLLREIAPKALVWHIFALYYDMHNIKLAVKERLMGRTLDRFFLRYGRYSMPTIRSAAVRESDDILQNKVLTAGLFQALRQEDVHDVDFVLDKTYLHGLRSMAEDLGVPEIVGFVVERIDLFNVSVYFQCLAHGSPEGYFAKAFSPHGSVDLAEWQAHIAGKAPGEISEFPLWARYRPIWENTDMYSLIDVGIDNYLIGMTKGAKLMSFGLIPLCAYFFNKFMEIKNIRILLNGKERKYQTEEIKSRMRIAYEL